MPIEDQHQLHLQRLVLSCTIGANPSALPKKDKTLRWQGVCVCDASKTSFVVVTFFTCRGHGSCFPSHANEAMGSSRKGMWTHIPVPAFLFVWQAAKPRTALRNFTSRLSQSGIYFLFST